MKIGWAVLLISLSTPAALGLWITMLVGGAWTTDPAFVNAVMPVLLGLLFIIVTCACWLLPFRKSTMGAAPKHELTRLGPIHQPDQSLLARHSVAHVALRAALFTLATVLLYWFIIGTVSFSATNEPYLSDSFNGVKDLPWDKSDNLQVQWMNGNVFRGRLRTTAERKGAAGSLEEWLNDQRPPVAALVGVWFDNSLDANNLTEPTGRIRWFHLSWRSAFEAAPPATLSAFLGTLDNKALLKNAETKAAESKAKLVVNDYAYELVRERLALYGRYKMIVFGPIQMATFWVFFFALSLLAVRRRTLAWQESIMHSAKFDEFTRAAGFNDGHAALNARVNEEGKQLVPRFPDRWSPAPQALNMTTYLRAMSDRESTVVEQFGGFITNQTPNAHSYVLGVLRLVWRDLYSRLSLDGAGVTESLSAAEAKLAQLRRRMEERLQRVEYAIIGYCLWAMPIIGFIGTVVGIAGSLGSADKVVRATDQVAQGAAVTLVTSQLGVAFDTTLVALVCSIPVMLLMFTSRARESKFLLDVEQQILRSAL